MLKSRTFPALVLVAGMAYGSCTLAENGVSTTQILIGQSASLTGTAAESGLQTPDGALAYFELVNRKVGINASKLKLITPDNAGHNSHGDETTQKFITP